MPEIKTYADNPAVAAEFAKYLCDWINAQTQDKITVSLSGGSTPKLLFQVLASDYAQAVDWSKVHLFWGDERCVAPDDAESNYGECKALLLDKISIPPENVHRVLGENDPAGEAVRYGDEIRQHVAAGSGGLPAFDLMILGMGGDGHTASIFPYQMELMKSENVCEVAVHPDSGQKRVTITGNVLNASKAVAFLITGGGKAEVLKTVVEQTGSEYPATHIQPAGSLTFFLDQAAAGNLS